MGTPWRLSARLCLWRLRDLGRLGRAQERGLLGAPGRAHRARLCWLLLGALPTLVSTEGGAGDGARAVPAGRRAEDALLWGAHERPRRLVLQPRVWLRAGALLARFLPLLLLLPLTYLAPGLAALWLRLLLKATEAAGPTCIKLGQWASTRRDLFSEAFCAHFSRLHVRVAPHPWAHTERFLRQAFGDDWERVLFFETHEPVGSGCVAQVYKAFASPVLLEHSEAPGRGEASGAGAAEALGALRKERRPPWNLSDQALLEQLLLSTTAPGRPHSLVPVAVKVLHPDLLSQVQVDLLLLKMGSQALGLLPGVQWLSLPEIVEEFEKLMIQQIDLRYEAQNLEHFQRNFQDVKSVKFPTPLRPFVTRDVLVETYEESVPVSSYQRAGIPAELKQRIARLGINMLLKMIFVDNFVHADLHPGNILVQGTDGLSPGREAQPQQVDVCDPLVVAVAPVLCPLRLVLLDAGIVAELQASDLRNFRAVFLAVVLGQGHRVAELILHHARASECSDVEGFKVEMAALVTQARRDSITLEKLHVSSLLSSVFRLLMTHKVKLESNFASVVFAIMVLEGLGRSLDPKLDILEAARPFLLPGPMARA